MSRLERLVAITGACLALTLPAGAQSWGAMAHPEKLPDNTSYCMLWHGDAAPLMNFMATASGLKYTVVSNAFTGVPVGAPVSFSFSDGTTIPVAPAGKPRAGQFPGLITGEVSAEAMSDILSRMALGSYGDAPMTVTAGERSQTFHLRSVAGDSSLFAGCRKEL